MLVLINRKTVMKGFTMKISRISVAGFLFLSAVGFTGTAFPVTIRGWVIDNDTCLPVTNLGVSCFFEEFEQPAFSQVGPDGYFELDSPGYGTAYINAYLPPETGYVMWNDEFYLHQDEILDPVILTVQKGALVHGRVVLWDGAAPGPEWEYDIYADGRHVSADVLKDANGYYSCRLPAGQYTISVDSDTAGLEAVVPLNFEVPIGASDVPLPNMVFYDSRYAGGTISASISIPALSADFGAALVILPQGELDLVVNPNQTRSVALKQFLSSGTVTAAHLPPGTYDAVLVISRIEGPDMIMVRDLKRNIVVTKGKTTSTTLSASTVGGTIRGQVINPYGNGIYNAQIMIRLGNVMYGQNATDPRGRFQFEYVGPGTYSLVLVHPRYQTTELTPGVTVANGQTVTLSTFTPIPFEGRKTGPDLNGNGYTGADDLMLLASHWLMPYPTADFDASGRVNLPDLATLERFWLTRDLWLGGIPKTPEGFVAVWEMNDNAANKIVADDAENGYPGTAQRNTSLLTTPGRIGTALSFNGTTDYIDFGTDPVLLPNAWTICAWVKCNDAATPVLVSFGGNYTSIKLQNNAKGKPVILLGPYNYRYFDASSWTTLKDGDWHHVAFTCPGKAQSDIQQARMFLDGVEVPVDSTLATDGQATKSRLFLGTASTSSTTLRFAGAMDDVVLYDRQLSQPDILRVMNRNP
jgi:hypothetical protein